MSFSFSSFTINIYKTLTMYDIDELLEHGVWETNCCLEKWNLTKRDEVCIFAKNFFNFLLWRWFCLLLIDGAACLNLNFKGVPCVLMYYVLFTYNVCQAFHWDYLSILFYMWPIFENLVCCNLSFSWVYDCVYAKYV